MEANSKITPDIFNGSRHLEIPFYQRAYVWDDTQWARFIEDAVEISLKRKPHFFGPVILKQRPSPTGESSGDVRLVIDGQQRLTTLTLFFKAVSIVDPSSASIFERQFRLRDGSPVVRHNYVDTAAFNLVLDANGKVDAYPNSQITKCFNYFLEELPKHKNIDADTVLNRVTFVCIDLGTEEDEQQIFDTINSLGVRLTTAELLKNYLFDRHNQEEYRQKWFKRFEEHEVDREYWGYEVTAGRALRENIELMLYALLQIKLNADPQYQRDGAKVEVRLDNLFGAYKEIIGRDLDTKSAMIHEINRYSQTYREYVDWTVTERRLTGEPGAERVMAIIFGLESTTLLPLTLFILRNVNDEAEQAAMFALLESYIMRRIVTRRASQGYNRLFTEQFVSHQPTDRASLAKQLNELENTTFAMPTDAELRNGFLESKLTNKQARGVLYLLETRIRGPHHSTDVLGLNQYSLEHVMPKKWVNHWGQLDSEDAKQERDQALHTLGNLALLQSKLNTAVRDYAWQRKKEGGSGKDGLSRFAHGLETFDNYLKRDIWDEAVIRERGEWLYSKAVEIWPAG